MHTDENEQITFTVEHSKENERILHVDGSANIVLNRKDPYGFWYVSFERGTIPESLNQAYTAIDRAYDAVQNYLNENGRRQRAAERERVRTAKTKFENKINAQE